MNTQQSKILAWEARAVIIFFLLFFSFLQIGYSQCGNEALDFDGIDDSVGKTLPASYGDITVTAWFNASSVVNGGAEDRVFSINIPRIEVGLEDDNVPANEGKLWFSDGSGTVVLSTSNLHDDTWHHLVYKRTGTESKMFLDGILVNTWTGNTAAYSSFFLVGNRPGGSGEFKGMIDEVSLYDVALSDIDIIANWDCPISGSEANLIGYWPFENGTPDGDNTSLTTTPDESAMSILGDGSLNNFTLMGSTSNFVCPSPSIIYNSNCGQDCSMACDTTVLDLSTGYDVDGDPITVGIHTAKWRVVGTPPGSGVSSGLFPFVLNTPGSWTDIPGAQYISPFDIVQNSFDNIATGTSFDFETCFCVCDDNSTITIDLSAYADNALDLDLYDNSDANGGAFVMNLLDISDAEGTGAFNGETFDSLHVLTLDAGQYCMKAALQNDGSVYMGLSINAIVSGAGLIKSDCCGYTSNGITGYVYDDKNCNGNYNMNGDGLLTGIQIELCDDIGTPIDTVLTDTLGLYTFSDLPAGMYSVKHIAVADYELIESPAVPFSLGATEVVGGLYFGLNYTGAITTEDFTSTCIEAGGSFRFKWCGQSCDCTIQIEARLCGTSDAYELIGSVPNTRSFTWSVPSTYSGDYEFQIVDCDGNIIPFSSCLTISDLDLDIQIVQTGCGIYDFNSTFTGSFSPIVSYLWEFGDYLNSTQASPTQDFPIAGTYEICLTVITNNGCQVETCQDLEVTEGTEDDCNFCPPNVLSEVVDGDLFIHNDKFGVIIQSQNGSCFRITVQDDGTLVTRPVECP